MSFIDSFPVVLLDMNGTFMFSQDRFGPDEDFAATYCRAGGTALPAQQIDKIIRTCYARMDADYLSPAKYDDFPQVIDVLRSVASEVPEEELHRLERVFGLHELGEVPSQYAACLHRLASNHDVGVVTNIWSKKNLWLEAFKRAGIHALFRSVIFSSDHKSIKPSAVLFSLAISESNADTSQIVFVGDSLRCDIQPAKQAGLSTVWLNSECVEHPDADHVAARLLDLVDDV